MDTMSLTGDNQLDSYPESMTITFGSASVSQPDVYKEVSLKTISGKEYRYQFYQKRRWEIELKRLPKAQSEHLNAWREANSVLSFCPDTLSTPAAEPLNVAIQNSGDPLSKMDGPYWDKTYSGKLILQEV